MVCPTPSTTKLLAGLPLRGPCTQLRACACARAGTPHLEHKSVVQRALLQLDERLRHGGAEQERLALVARRQGLQGGRKGGRLLVRVWLGGGEVRTYMMSEKRL